MWIVPYGGGRLRPPGDLQIAVVIETDVAKLHARPKEKGREGVVRLRPDEIRGGVQGVSSDRGPGLG